MDINQIFQQIEQSIGLENERIIYYYKVCFKCSIDIYSTLEKRQYGDMVIVHCDRGYNVGFIDIECTLDDFYQKHQDHNQRPKKILSFLQDDDQTIRKMLLSKIAAENYALHQCKAHIKGRKLSIFADTITTEFQFDRKKLTIYIKKYDDVSVCRLVRKLYEVFKMRIKVLEVDSANTLHDLAWKYLEVSKLNIPFNEIFTFDINSSTVPFLNSSFQSSEINSIQNTNIRSQELLSPSTYSNNQHISALENNSQQVLQFHEKIRHPPQIISNIHKRTTPDSSSRGLSQTLLTQPFHQDSYYSHHHQHNNQQLQQQEYQNREQRHNEQQYHNQRHSAPSGLIHYQAQKLPRDTTSRSKSLSYSNIEQQSSSSTYRSHINHRPLVWSPSMNDDTKLENKTSTQYNISAQPFHPKNQYYNHNNNINEISGQYNDYYQHNHHNSENTTNDNDYSNNILKHQSYHFRPQFPYKQTHELHKINSTSNQYQDSSNSDDFYQPPPESYDAEDLISDINGRIRLLTTNSGNYPHYIFESLPS